MGAYDMNPCPKCGGKIILCMEIERGVYAQCEQCKSEFDVGKLKDRELYYGLKIRMSTLKKVTKLWNIRQAQLLEQFNRQEKTAGVQELK